MLLRRALPFLLVFFALPLGRGAQQTTNVWVYSLVATDHDGHLLLKHFIDHYHGLGIPYTRFHLDLLHDPEEDDTGLLASQQLLKTLEIEYASIVSPYTPAMQDIHMINALYHMRIPPCDWVIVADTDELYYFGYASIADAIAVMEEEGATYAMGETLDHAARSGKLEALKEAPVIWDQYPMICPIIAEVAQGLPAKCTIHKGFLRTGAGHHHIVDPNLAKAYFGRCKGPACEVVMKTYKQRSTIDLYRVTPYHQFHSFYHYLNDTESPTHGWEAKAWSRWTKNHHFKWHAGLKNNLYHRMVRDSGDCRLGVNEDTCTPKFQFWKEVARQYMAVATGKGFNLTRLGCKENIDTLWTW